MTAAALVESLLAAGVILTAESGRLLCDGPETVLTDTVMAELAAHKAEILAALAGPDTEPGPVDPAPPTARVPWSELQHQRWGPAIGDPTPGITIPLDYIRRPTDPAAELAARTDPYALVERESIQAEAPGGARDEDGPGPEPEIIVPAPGLREGETEAEYWERRKRLCRLYREARGGLRQAVYQYQDAVHEYPFWTWPRMFSNGGGSSSMSWGL